LHTPDSMPRGDRKNFMSEYNIGVKIRKLRHDKRMTLQKVSTEIGVSPALISQIENGHISPPIATLTKIARFFDVRVADFFTEDDDACRFEIVRAKEHQALRSRSVGDGICHAVELFSNHKFQKKLLPQLLTVSGKRSEKKDHSHAGEEFIFVMEGTAKVIYGTQIITLEAGDSMYFDAATGHDFMSEDGNDVKVISIVSK
jgi:transcriptional regulator with XRE-family HTH domain